MSNNVGFCFNSEAELISFFKNNFEKNFSTKPNSFKSSNIWNSNEMKWVIGVSVVLIIVIYVENIKEKDIECIKKIFEEEISKQKEEVKKLQDAIKKKETNQESYYYTPGIMANYISNSENLKFKN